MRCYVGGVQVNEKKLYKFRRFCERMGLEIVNKEKKIRSAQGPAKNEGRKKHGGLKGYGVYPSE